MSFRWPPKDPDEILDYSVDWSRFLGTATVSSVNWFIDDADEVKTAFNPTDVVDGLQNVSESNTTTVTTINLALGTLNKEYKLYCQMTDSTGSVVERVIKIRIKEQ